MEAEPLSQLLLVPSQPSSLGPDPAFSSHITCPAIRGRAPSGPQPDSAHLGLCSEDTAELILSGRVSPVSGPAAGEGQDKCIWTETNAFGQSTAVRHAGHLSWTVLQALPVHLKKAVGWVAAPLLASLPRMHEASGSKSGPHTQGWAAPQASNLRVWEEAEARGAEVQGYPRLHKGGMPAWAT